MAGAELQVDCYECVVSMSVVAKQKISNITSELSYSINNYYLVDSIENGSILTSAERNFDKSLLSFPHRLFYIWPFGQTIISETTTRINNQHNI